jgi:uncharacterized protein YgfB (UPF0149 family)
MLNYQEVSELFEHVPYLESVAYVHGLTSGMLASQAELDKALWWQSVSGDEMGSFDEDSYAGYVDFIEAVYQRLNSAECDFEVLLPDEGLGLDARIEALAFWVNGFLFGLAAHEQPVDLTKLSDESQEMLADLSHIAAQLTAALGAEMSEEDVEEAHADLIEVEEYVKVIVLTLNEELLPYKLKNVPVPGQYVGEDAERLH